MLKFLTAGESHGPQLTVILDGFPAGFTLDIKQIDFQLARRQKGYGRGGRMKIEQDRAIVVSGVRGCKTLGGPITLIIKNKDWPNWSEIMDPIKPVGENLGLKEQRLANETRTPRPGHADLSGGIKWNHHDLRNVLERASARETAARVGIGSVARQFLEHFGVTIVSHVVRIGSVSLPDDKRLSDLKQIRELSEKSEVRCVDVATEKLMIDGIKLAKKKRDSLGGIVELNISGMPAGLGGFSQWSDRLDGQLSGALMAVHSVKGVEIGLGFKAAEKRGSEVHDEIFYDPDGNPAKKKFYRKTNNAGGLEGGITNGEDIVIRIANKPISTLNQPLHSVDVVTKKEAEAMVERTDNCVVPALGVVCEAVAALVLADVFMGKFGSDNMLEIERNYQSYLDDDY